MKTLIAAYAGVLRGTGSSILSALQDLSWLSKSKVEKQLQIISVLQWVISFLTMGVICTIILIYMLCTDCWIITVLYLVWYAFDWNTPRKAGRRSQWIRNWAIWRYFRDYFPIRMIKTHNLAPNRNYILGYHPHGIMSLGAFCNFSTEATGVSQIFPGIRPYVTTLTGNFRWPILRDYLMTGVGEPITVPKTDNPSQKEIDFYHNLYVQSLVTLFDKYKAKFGLTELETLEIN
ncbi:diacylglycerol O-acyltransferase 2-like [Protobothrops mucrosquamatus]|uniref:diacylglycerol O-acyltransferase 2-like n=1 Tax=Protobothrops mucrosquamatus TaxID=103944 RepID=UPI000775C1C0|nr:diacylglycerol O-acyltransferase 2-like [Protobothrops mucrosquamatus]